MKYLVVGAGKSGVAAANFLAGRGEEVALTDSNPHPDVPYPLDNRVARFFGYQNESALNAVNEVVVSPGVPLTIPLLQRAAAQAIPVIGEIELAYRFLKGTIIAV
ncbi:MAG TPA: UDP-N-acetylmuramoyl-L-alanine--D-glutamate ligase, partial [Thermoanaerobaculia bacterium]|nr:UDP-N-acetylmuramoyl-L-alanine--D-glutamate ligase [Thermoanaerobaculia bacterium]